METSQYRNIAYPASVCLNRTMQYGNGGGWKEDEENK